MEDKKIETTPNSYSKLKETKQGKQNNKILKQNKKNLEKINETIKDMFFEIDKSLAILEDKDKELNNLYGDLLVYKKDTNNNYDAIQKFIHEYAHMFDYYKWIYDPITRDYDDLIEFVGNKKSYINKQSTIILKTESSRYNIEKYYHGANFINFDDERNYANQDLSHYLIYDSTINNGGKFNDFVISKQVLANLVAMYMSNEEKRKHILIKGGKQIKPESFVNMNKYDYTDILKPHYQLSEYNGKTNPDMFSVTKIGLPSLIGNPYYQNMQGVDGLRVVNVATLVPNKPKEVEYDDAIASTWLLTSYFFVIDDKEKTFNMDIMPKQETVQISQSLLDNWFKKESKHLKNTQDLIQKSFDELVEEKDN